MCLLFCLCILSDQRPFQASERRLKIWLSNIERLLDHVLKRTDRGVDCDTRLVTRFGSKPYFVKKPRLEQVGGRCNGLDRMD